MWFVAADFDWLIGTLAVIVWVIVQLAAARGTRKSPPRPAPQRLPPLQAPEPPRPAGEPVNPQEEIREFLESMLGTELPGGEQTEESASFVPPREAPPPPRPPPIPRRARPRAVTAPPLPTPVPATPVVIPQSEPVRPSGASTVPPAQRPTTELMHLRSRELRAMFQQRPTLRTMILASEILGPPLALRPPLRWLGTVGTQRLPAQPPP